MTALGLGTAQLGSHYGVSNLAGQPSAAEAEAIVALAAERGVRLLDTAPAYGGVEDLLGRLLPAGPGIRIVTKTPPLDGDEVTPAFCEAVKRSAQRSLERLRRDRLDALLVHHGSELSLAGGERLARCLVELREAGTVERIGASVYAPEELEAVAEAMPLDLVQLPLNAFDQRFLRDETLARLRREGVEAHARSVFLQGLLLMEPDELPPRLDAAGEPLRRYHEARGRGGLSPLEAALGFVRSAGAVDVALVGANSARELDECLAALETGGTAMDFESLAVDDPAVVDPRRWTP